MPRPPLPPWTTGNISITERTSADGTTYIARCYYNDANGQRREVTASAALGKPAEAASKTQIDKAQRDAKAAVIAKVTAAKDEYRGGDETLSHATKLDTAAQVWLAWKKRQKVGGKPLAPQTIYDYEGYVRRCITGGALANLPLTAANDVGRIESWLADIADSRGETAAKQARKVLGGILKLAERRGAIPASVMHRVEMPGASPGSPGDRKCTADECDYDCGKRHLDTRRAFTPEEMTAVLAAAGESRADVADLCLFLFGTGARIAEALHCTFWSDVDLDAGTVRVRGTKTANADRVLQMSPNLIECLRLRAEKYQEHGGLVFGITRYADKMGKQRDRNNVCKAIRRLFAAADVRWAGTHTFRRTVATWMDADSASLAEIANQLGHRDTNVTAGYLGRKAKPTRAAAVMVLPPSKPRLHAG